MAGTIIGLRDVHYALLIDDDETGVAYETPVRIRGAVQASINPNPSVETLFADDGPMDSATTLGQIELELQMADFPLSVQAVLLGHTMTADGVLERKSTDTPPWVALGFKSLKSNGSYRYVWLLKGRFLVPEMTNETRGETVTFQTPTMSARFVNREYDDLWMRSTDEDEEDFKQPIADNWFNDVEPNPGP